MTETSIWKQRVARWQASGQSALAFSRGKGFAASDLRSWARALGKVAAPSPVPSVQFARVVTPGSARSMAPAEPAPLTIEVGGARVIVGVSFDSASLTAVIAILRAAPGGPS